MTRSATIAVIPGDGIGPEVVHASMSVIAAAADAANLTLSWNVLPFGAEHYLATGETLPDGALEHLRRNAHAVLVGALGDPRIPDDRHARDILFGLRFGLDLFVNFRPVKLMASDLCPLRHVHGDEAIDLVILRENTEGIYAGRGRSSSVGTMEEEQIVEEVHTAPKVARIIREAFVYARAEGRTRVTLCDKSNAVPGHRLWRRLFEDIGAQFPEIEREARYIDALAMEVLRDPQRFQVIVTNNLFGDILSDLAAQLVGGLGVAPSVNYGAQAPSLFEPVHGSAPPLAGKGTANPVATLLTGALMLDRLDAGDGGTALRDAVVAVTRRGIRTPDLGGTASTSDVAESVLQSL